MNHASLIAETGRCVACGLCLPHCPTYRKTQSEADSPRGRILLTQAVAQGALPINQRYIEHIDLCLNCRACELTCPNHVHFGTIVDQARAMIREKHTPSLPYRLAAHVVSSSALLRAGAAALRLANTLGLQKIFKALPTASRPYRWKASYPSTAAQGEVTLFLGCVSNALDAETLAASVFVLNRLGYTVHIPSAQTCCGGLHHQAGDSTGAAALDERNLGAFSPFDGLPVLSVASGCGTRLLEFMPQRVQDISAFLAEAQGWETVEIKPLQARIALHEPCTLRNVFKTAAAPYALLQRIPDAEILALPGNSQCCGGAGSYMLTQPEMADSLRDDKIAACIKLAPEYLATSNIGCALHLANGLNEAGLTVKLVHPVVLLAKQMGFDGTL